MAIACHKSPQPVVFRVKLSFLHCPAKSVTCGCSSPGSSEWPGLPWVPEVGDTSSKSGLPHVGLRLHELLDMSPPGAPAPAPPMFAWSPGRQRGGRRTLSLPHCPSPTAQQTFVLQPEQQAGVPLGNRRPEEVNTGCPVRVFALIRELPDHKGCRVGVGRLLPWRSPTHRDKHPRAGLALGGGGAPQEVALEGPGDPAVQALPLPPSRVTHRSGVCSGMMFPQRGWRIF